MSLLIKGMDMPEYRDVFGNGQGCVCLLMLTVNKDGTASVQFNDVDGGFYRMKKIPTPHGRLIDAEKLIAVLKSAIPYEQRTSTVLCMIKNIENAPTVIEKEETE